VIIVMVIVRLTKIHEVKDKPRFIQTWLLAYKLDDYYHNSILYWDTFSNIKITVGSGKEE